MNRYHHEVADAAVGRLRDGRLACQDSRPFIGTLPRDGPYPAPGGDWRFTISWFRAGSPLQIVGAIDVDEDGRFLVIVTAMQKEK